MIVKIKAGLGNQMFQYAFGRMMILKYGINDVKFDYSYINNYRKSGKLSCIDQLCITDSVATSDEIRKQSFFSRNAKPYTLKFRGSVFIDKTINRKYYYESNRDYVNPESLLSFEYIDGYWQSWRYVDGLEGVLRKEFESRGQLTLKTQKAIQEFRNETNSVMVCIRKGDYERNAYTKRHFYQCSNDYYNNAMKYMASKIDNPKFIVFTNDVEFVKQNMHFTYPVLIRENSDFVNDYEELQVMRACKHSIISNSTFHWWGAWLNNNPSKIVVAPYKWFGDGKPIDIIPPKWIKINEAGESV